MVFTGRTVHSGEGWRVGWHPHNLEYQGLLGSDNWAIELTQAEFRDFHRLLSQLLATMAEMETELMDGERISCEAETDLIWIEVEGFPRSYSLRFILNCDRRCEGSWNEGVAPKLLSAIQSLDLI